MIDIKLLRENPGIYKENIRNGSNKVITGFAAHSSGGKDYVIIPHREANNIEDFVRKYGEDYTYGLEAVFKNREKSCNWYDFLPNFLFGKKDNRLIIMTIDRKILKLCVIIVIG